MDNIELRKLKDCLFTFVYPEAPNKTAYTTFHQEINFNISNYCNYLPNFKRHDFFIKKSTYLVELQGVFIFNHVTNLVDDQVRFMSSDDLCLFLTFLP